MKFREIITKIRNIKIVKLPNDRYAIRKGWFKHWYFAPAKKEWLKYPYTDTCTGELDHVATFYDFMFLDMSKEVEVERYR